MTMAYGSRLMVLVVCLNLLEDMVQIFLSLFHQFLEAKIGK